MFVDNGRFNLVRMIKTFQITVTLSSGNEI